MKRAFDLAVVITAHILLLPVVLSIWAIIPVSIWLFDQGPVFFRQERVGKGGKIFVLFKFRTMAVGSENSGPAWTVNQDNRVTFIGKLLRRTALDELPGIINILKGDMSLVGPRALDVEEQLLFEKRIPGFDARLQVTPGLTGLAQVYDELDIAEDKLRYDLEYIQTHNFWMDLHLLMLSVRNSIMGQWDRRGGKRCN